MDNPHTLIIDLADLPSLTAVAVHPGGDPFVLWHPHLRSASADIRKRLVKTHSEIYSAARVFYGGLPIPHLADEKSPGWWMDAALLIDALRVAQRCDCRRIIWPVQAGHDFELGARIVERATLASTLAVSGDTPRIVIDMPLLDLSEKQVVELLDDCVTNTRLFWPCEHAELTPCGMCGECGRWKAGFEEAGPAWPWSAVPEAAQVAVS